jgi:hypothetical protein
MTTYTTRTLAEKIMPTDAEENIKGATRTLRKFLRDTLGEGKAVVGKGGRYALEYNAKEITALKKQFKSWTITQEEEKAKRAALREEINASRALASNEDDTATDEEIIDEGDESPEGPSDEEIAAMLSDEDEADDEV